MFYLQDEEEPIEVAMMRSRGEYKTAFSDAFKAQIIELPYEVGTYMRSRPGWVGFDPQRRNGADDDGTSNSILIVLAE